MYVKQTCLPNCLANKVSKSTIAIRFNLLQVCPPVSLFVLYVLFTLFFYFIFFIPVIFVSLGCVPVPTLLILVHLVTFQFKQQRF